MILMTSLSKPFPRSLDYTSYKIRSSGVKHQRHDLDPHFPLRLYRRNAFLPPQISLAGIFAKKQQERREVEQVAKMAFSPFLPIRLRFFSLSRGTRFCRHLACFLSLSPSALYHSLIRASAFATENLGRDIR